MEELLKLAMKLDYSYRFKFYDYEPTEWVIESRLTEERINRLLNDNSISEIQIIIKIK
jgi:hypothetical protein